MKFSVSSEVFEKLDNVCFGVIVAKGIDNSLVKNDIVEKLDQ